MKSIKSFYIAIIFAFIVILSGCKKDAENATSQICSEVRGIEAIYWDLMNGIPRTDIPGGVPIVDNPGGTYSHPSYPLLGFIYPAGWTPFTDNTSGWIGVNLIRNDNQAIWRYSALFTTSAVTTDFVLNAELSAMRSFFGSSGAVTTICANGGTFPRAAGITTTGQSVLIRFDGFTALLQVQITTQIGLLGQQIIVAVTASPTADFENEIMNTFLPIDYQLLFTGGGEQDSDNDGEPDNTDEFPFDPTKQ